VELKKKEIAMTRQIIIREEGDFGWMYRQRFGVFRRQRVSFVRPRTVRFFQRRLLRGAGPQRRIEIGGSQGESNGSVCVKNIRMTPMVSAA
jgi:hypothetical protein